MPQCPYCQGIISQVRAGKNPSGSQRYRCQMCKRKYTPSPEPNGYSRDLRKKAVLLCLEGQSYREVGRMLGVNHQSVINWINLYLAQNSRVIDRFVKRK
jgi:transposase-like protein